MTADEWAALAAAFVVLVVGAVIVVSLVRGARAARGARSASRATTGSAQSPPPNRLTHHPDLGGHIMNPAPALDACIADHPAGRHRASDAAQAALTLAIIADVWDRHGRGAWSVLDDAIAAYRDAKETTK